MNISPTPLRCFFLKPTDRMQLWLRRYDSNDGNCPAGSYHDARVLLKIVPVILNERGCIGEQPHPDHASPLWPKTCVCGYEFRPHHNWQVIPERIYRRNDTGSETTLRDAPPGAIWNADWYPDEWKGPDGLALIARCPDGQDWFIDGRASNCTMPGDKIHKCWCRHGAPPDLTVDKNGNTCNAGAGSIQTRNWHGFLRGGFFVT